MGFQRVKDEGSKTLSPESEKKKRKKKMMMIMVRVYTTLRYTGTLLDLIHGIAIIILN